MTQNSLESIFHREEQALCDHTQEKTNTSSQPVRSRNKILDYKLQELGASTDERTC